MEIAQILQWPLWPPLDVKRSAVFPERRVFSCGCVTELATAKAGTHIVFAMARPTSGVRTMRKMLVATTLATLLLSGCAWMGVPGYVRGPEISDYARFYVPDPSATQALALGAMRVAPPTGSPQVARVVQYDENVAAAYARQGYVLIGQSSFTSGEPESEQGPIDQGIAVGADLVMLLNPTYQGTVTTSVNATTTPYGTTYVPMNYQRSGYSAGYFVKLRTPFGVYLRDLTDSERQVRQTNRGAYVVTVVDNSPAYNSDILPGDVIVSINGQSPSGYTNCFELINANRGRTVEVTIVRFGKTLSKHVSLLE
jgi:hypothetical protein